MKKVRGATRGRWKWGVGAGLALLVLAAAVFGLRGLRPTVAGLSAPRPALALTALSADPVPSAGPSPVDYARLDERIRTLMQEPDMVGFAIATVEKGQVRFVKTYGEVLAGSGVPVTPDTVFRWGSVSKGVAAALVTKLAESGKLSLDAPVARFNTTLRLPGDARNVTIADILSHRTGLVRNAWDDRLEAGEDPKLLRGEMATLAPLCPPSTCYAYQNIAFDTASEIVETVTRSRYAAVARDKLFQPLGMTGASVGQAGLETAPSWARPHHLGRVPAKVNGIYYRVPAAAGVNSSIRDLVRWMRAQMGDAPTILSPAALETMHRPRVSTPPHGPLSAMDKALKKPSYGLAWRSFDYAGHHLVGHRGTVDGYGSLVTFDPVDRSGIVMLWNSNWYRAARLQLEFFDMLYGLPATDWLDLPLRAGRNGADGVSRYPGPAADRSTGARNPASRAAPAKAKSASR